MSEKISGVKNKMKVPKYSVVPWRNPEQFQKVAKCLYSPSIIDKRWAVDQISVWESRSHPALPTAIDATVGLVRAVIQDLIFEMDKSFCQAKDIQMFYAMALVRFVNLTLEIDQSFKKVQLATLAEKKNIPKWLIDLRHEAVHTYCPSLPILRIGAETALTYLEDTFWKVESANIQCIVKTPPDNAEIRDLITRYRNIQHSREKKKGKSKELYSDLKVVLKGLEKQIEDSREQVLDALLEPRVFLCPEDLKILLGNTIFNAMEYEEMPLPPVVEWFWLPVIRRLHQYDLINRFLEKLLRSQEHCKITICQILAAAWARRLLLAGSIINHESKLDGYFLEKGVVFNMKRLLHACMMGITKHLLPVLEIITNRMEYEDQEKHQELYTLAALKLGMFVGNSSSVVPASVSKTPPTKRCANSLPDIVFTLEDAEEDIQELKRMKRKRKDDNIWSEAPASINWSKIPFGAVLNPVKVSESKEDPQTGPLVEDLSEEKYIFSGSDEDDNEEETVEQVTTDKDWLKTFKLTEFEMLYMYGQKRRFKSSIRK